MPWVYDPHSGGVKIPPAVQKRTEQRIRAYAEQHYAGKFTRLGIRFKGALCYVDAYVEPEEPTPDLLKIVGKTREEYLEEQRNMPVQLCRLRHFAEDRWSMAYYSYARMKYDPSVLDTGKFEGTLEEAFSSGAVFLAEN